MSKFRIPPLALQSKQGFPERFLIESFLGNRMISYKQKAPSSNSVHTEVLLYLAEELSKDFYFAKCTKHSASHLLFILHVAVVMCPQTGM